MVIIKKRSSVVMEFVTEFDSKGICITDGSLKAV